MNTALQSEDYENSLISQEMDRLHCNFNWESVCILDQARSKNARAFLEVCI